MSIDWNKAPEWATHYGEETETHCASWFRVIGGKVCSYAPADEHPLICRTALEGDAYYHQVSDLLAPWTGEGPPPVGAHIEWCGNSGGYWVRAQIIAVDDAQVVIQNDKDQEYRPGLFEVKDCALTTFRPIRTPEQLADAERQEAIQQMREAVGSLNAYPFEELYDAGYRKVVES